MESFIVVEDEGEYSSREWKIVAVLSNKYAALKRAWHLAMNNWNADYHVQHWDITASSDVPVRVYYIKSRKMSFDLASHVISELETKLLVDSEIPDMLMKYTVAS